MNSQVPQGTLYLGIPHARHLAVADRPVFISRRTLQDRRTFPRATAPWALDSGGFTELKDKGAWQVSETDYVAMVRTFQTEVGQMEWAAPMDWMCEPIVLRKTGLAVAEHQRRTVQNFLTLRNLAPDLPIIPVVQGWERDDYLRCVDLYGAVGVDLTCEPVVGVGSVCRRNSDDAIADVAWALVDAGLSVHLFGVRGTAYRALRSIIQSADSMAWSMRAWWHGKPHYPDCTHKNCANCYPWAQEWHTRQTALPVVPAVRPAQQLGLFPVSTR